MRLSDFMDILEGKLLSDGHFDTLEYCTATCEQSFLTFLENPKYLAKINPKASCVFVTKENVPQLPSYLTGIMECEDPKKQFVLLHNHLAGCERYAGADFRTVIGKNCLISPLAYISDRNVVIGDGVYVGPFSAINKNVRIGNNCVIHENCVLGGKSFNYAKTGNGEMIGMADAGQVVIEENVEICPHCHVASAPLPSDVTYLGESVKLDAFVHIGHGTKIGRRTLIPAGAQIAGNVTIGEDAWIGVNATIANRITIRNKGRISLGAVVTRDVDEDQTVSGNFAIPHDRFIRNLKDSAG